MKILTLTQTQELECNSIAILEYGDRVGISSNSSGMGGGDRECLYSISVSSVSRFSHFVDPLKVNYEKVKQYVSEDDLMFPCSNKPANKPDLPWYRTH